MNDTKPGTSRAPTRDSGTFATLASLKQGARIPAWLGPVVSVAVLGIALWFLHRELKSLSPNAILGQIESVTWPSLLLAAVCATGSYSVLAANESRPAAIARVRLARGGGRFNPDPAGLCRGNCFSSREPGSWQLAGALAPAAALISGIPGGFVNQPRALLDTSRPISAGWTGFIPK